MRLFIVAAAFIGLAVLASEADAADKAPKPSVCLSYQLATGKDSKPFAICYDSEKPALFTRFAEVVVPGKGGGSVKALVGWR